MIEYQLVDGSWISKEELATAIINGERPQLASPRVERERVYYQPSGWIVGDEVPEGSGESNMVTVTMGSTLGQFWDILKSSTPVGMTLEGIQWIANEVGYDISEPINSVQDWTFIAGLMLTGYGVAVTVLPSAGVGIPSALSSSFRSYRSGGMTLAQLVMSASLLGYGAEKVYQMLGYTAQQAAELAARLAEPSASEEWLALQEAKKAWDIANPPFFDTGQVVSDTLGTRQDIMSYLKDLGYEDVDMLPIVNQVMSGVVDINSVPSDFEDDDLDTGDSLSYYEGLELALSDVFPSAEQFQDLEPDVVYEDVFGKRSRSYERDGDFSSPESGGFDASSEGEGFVPNDSSKKGDFMSYGYRRRSYGRFANVGRRRWSPAFTQGYYAGKRSGRRY